MAGRSIRDVFHSITERDGTAKWRCRVLVGEEECGERLKKQDDGSTSALTRHLSTKHSNNDKEKMNAVIEETVARLSGSSKRQKTPTATFWTEGATALPYRNYAEVEEIAIDHIIKKGVPLDSYEGEDGAWLLHIASGISARTVGRRLEDRCSKVKRRLVEELNEQPSLSLASDIWTSSDGQSFLAIYGLFIWIRL
jgi:hypothetical protein